MADYSIWICEYASVPAFPKSVVLQDWHNHGTQKLPYCYVVIQGHGHVAMVDVGYNHRDYGETLAERFGVVNWHSPAHVLAKCGLAPEDVDTVFVSHAHFDHFGNVEAFPNATFYIQEREISKWVWAMSLPERLQWLMTGMDPADIVRGVRLAAEGRLVTVDGTYEDVLPGIDLHPAFDTHTFGSMYVHLRNDGQRESADSWVLAGDLVYAYENIHGDGASVGVDTLYVPIGLSTGGPTNLLLKTEEMMGRVDHESRRIIPVHEDRLGRDFPSHVGDDGLRVTEICLARGQTSCLPD